jgi:4-diphosphocytidyl-2-C-methyl-D-erythritol kinase
MICFPNAKINIGLNIVEKRSDGFHNIETVFYLVPLCDVLEIRESSALSFHMEGIPVEGDPDKNLCLKAYRELQGLYKIPPVEMYLLKGIPTGAGLGGGSSDAAFTIKLLNSLFSLGLTENFMEQTAAKLGSDCPFFIRNQPVYASGKGDIFSPVSVSLKGKYIVIVKPAIHMSTPEAYSLIKPAKPEFVLASEINTTIVSWKNTITNDFELPVISKFPLIGELIKKLYANGAAYAAMSGSGSAVYGLFEKETDLKDLFEGNFYYSGILS